jgi:hypothetical protein
MGKKKNKSEFGMLSVKAGIDNNPNPSQADRIVGAQGAANIGKLLQSQPGSMGLLNPNQSIGKVQSMVRQQPTTPMGMDVSTNAQILNQAYDPRSAVNYMDKGMAKIGKIQEARNKGYDGMDLQGALAYLDNKPVNKITPKGPAQASKKTQRLRKKVRKTKKKFYESEVGSKKEERLTNKENRQTDRLRKSRMKDIEKEKAKGPAQSEKSKKEVVKKYKKKIDKVDKKLVRADKRLAKRNEKKRKKFTKKYEKETTKLNEAVGAKGASKFVGTTPKEKSSSKRIDKLEKKKEKTQDAARKEYKAAK